MYNRGVTWKFWIPFLKVRKNPVSMMDKVWLVTFVCPSVWGLQVVLNHSLVPSNFYKHLQKWDRNLVSLSKIILLITYKNWWPPCNKDELCDKHHHSYGMEWSEPSWEIGQPRTHPHVTKLPFFMHSVMEAIMELRS